MKKLISIFSLSLLLVSCTEAWDNESQQLFKQGCMEDAKERGMPENEANSMCQCRLDVAMKKYPQLADALENIDSLINDPKLKDCK